MHARPLSCELPLHRTLYLSRVDDLCREDSRVYQRTDAGRGARYTRGRGPVVLLASRGYRDQGTALRVEAAIKKLPRAQKLAMAANRRQWPAVARAVQNGSR